MTLSEAAVLAISLLTGAAVLLTLQRRGVLNFRAFVGPRPSPLFLRDVSGLPVSLWFVCAALVFLSLVLGAPLATLLPANLAGGPPGQTLCAFAASCGVALLLLYLIAPRTGPRAGIRFALGDLPRGLLAALCIAPFYTATAIASQWFARDVLGSKVPELAHVSLVEFVKSPLSASGITIGVTAVLLVPIAEECMYRVFLGSSLVRFLDGPGRRGPAPARTTLLSVLITAALFALAHTGGSGPVPWAAVPGLFVLALGLGLAYERTARPGVPIVAHALFNLANLALAAAAIRQAQ